MSSAISGGMRALVSADIPNNAADTTGKSAKTDALNSASTVVDVAAATAPVVGQVLTATDSTHATWQAGGTQIAAVTTQFDKTSSTSLASVPGLSLTLAAGRTYRIAGTLNVAPSGIGGFQFSLSGTATATSIWYGAIFDDYENGLISMQAGGLPATALNTAYLNNGGGTLLVVHIDGTIKVNAAGTLLVRFAQNVSDGTPSSVLVGSTLAATLIS